MNGKAKVVLFSVLAVILVIVMCVFGVNGVSNKAIGLEEKDVYITTSNTYQRFYTEQMVKDYFGEVEFIVSNNSLRLFRLIV